MKKFILLISLTLLTVVASAQFTFGVKLGYTASKLPTNIPGLKDGVKSNFLFGAFTRFGKKVIVQPEVYFATSGGIYTDSAGSKQTIKLKNLDIPVLVGFKLIEAKVFNIRVLVGPVASFVLGKDVQYNDLTQIEEQLEASSLKDIIWKFDAGLGVDVLFLTLDVRYEWGLNNLYNPPDVKPSYDIKNNVFNISVGFKFM
jgi:hypothetical protein